MNSALALAWPGMLYGMGPNVPWRSSGLLLKHLDEVDNNKHLEHLLRKWINFTCLACSGEMYCHTSTYSEDFCPAR